MDDGEAARERPGGAARPQESSAAARPRWAGCRGNARPGQCFDCCCGGGSGDYVARARGDRRDADEVA